MRDIAQFLAMKAVDGISACLPSRVPPLDNLQRCKVISHRGEHDNVGLFENTLPAFDLARSHGVWGLEADIRWTADLVPVICHDPDGARLYADSSRIDALTFAQLRQRMPLVPTLAELVVEFGGSMHLMLEIKDEAYPQPRQQKEILRQTLTPLMAGRDYHFLALATRLFEHVDFVAPKYCFPVAEVNTRQMSRLALEQGLGGLTGHFLLLNRSLQKKHAANNQRIGTGFVCSKNCLYRELGRGVEWIFSNDAVKIQRIRDNALSHLRRETSC